MSLIEAAGMEQDGHGGGAPGADARSQN